MLLYDANHKRLTLSLVLNILLNYKLHQIHPLSLRWNYRLANLFGQKLLPYLQQLKHPGQNSNNHQQLNRICICPVQITRPCPAEDEEAGGAGGGGGEALKGGYNAKVFRFVQRDV